MTRPGRYRVPGGPHRVEELVRRSRFITTLDRAETPAMAEAFVASQREEFPDATHHCWAYVAGPPGETSRIGMSDDGEPHGTAGRPMLNALLHGRVGEVVAVCVRYYGGVKLGTGGLSRAYGGGVKSALASLPTIERVERTSLVVTVGYPEIDAVRRLAAERDVLIEAEEYGADIVLRCAVPLDEVDAFASGLADATRGGASISE